MNNKKIIAVFTLAFALGFYASEYRHASRDKNSLLISESYQPKTAAASTVFFESPTLISSQQASSRSFVTSNVLLLTQAQSPLEQANQLITNGAYSEAAHLLNRLLELEPKNTEALWLLARVYEQQGQHAQSVAIWFRYINTEIDAQKIEHALTYLAKYVIRLTENPSIFGENNEWLMTQINNLIKLTPDNGELHLQLAKMYLNKEDKEQAQYHAIMATNQPETQTRAEAFLAKLDGDALVQDEIEVPLIRFGDQFLVPIMVEGLQTKLLLDTGASISGLTSSFINRHYSLVKSPKPIQLNTASGTVESFLFVVDTLSIDNITFNKQMLARLPMDNGNHFDGLLGVDILGRFDFVIDQNKAVLMLRKR